MYNIVVSLLVLAVAIETCGAITCYNCLSSGNKDCGMSFSSSGIKTCESKYCTRVEADSAGTIAVSRGCSAVKPYDGCKSTGSGAVTTNTCYCESSYCNDAARVTGRNILVLSAMVLATFVL
ncbi:hypothetical protein LSAT2_007868 [Lamellibrachia satsuma]|nr:hypothetical protein LSAT2_007868 [Lamellibrachia satsuma]